MIPQVSLRKIVGIQFASLKKAIVKNQTPVNDIMNKADYQIQQMFSGLKDVLRFLLKSDRFRE